MTKQDKLIKLENDLLNYKKQVQTKEIINAIKMLEKRINNLKGIKKEKVKIEKKECGYFKLNKKRSDTIHNKKCMREFCNKKYMNDYEQGYINLNLIGTNYTSVKCEEHAKESNLHFLTIFPELRYYKIYTDNDGLINVSNDIKNNSEGKGVNEWQLN